MAISSWPKKLKRLYHVWSSGWNMSRSNISNIGFQETKLGGSETPNSGFTFQTRCFFYVGPELELLPVPLIARIKIFVACGTLGRQIPATKIQLFGWCPSQRLQLEDIFGDCVHHLSHHLEGKLASFGNDWHITLGALWISIPWKKQLRPRNSLRRLNHFMSHHPPLILGDGNDNSVKPPTSQNL